MADMNPNEAPKQFGDEKGKPGTEPRMVRKRPRINAPMPTPSPSEKRIEEETRRLVRLYGRIQGR